MLAPAIAETFSGKIHSIVLQSDVRAYRYSGGTVDPGGRFLTTRTTVARIGAGEATPGQALNLSPGNTAERLSTFIIPKGTQVFIGGVQGGAPWAKQIFVADSRVLIPVP